MADTHHVKSWPPLFQASIEDRKTHDLRLRDERDYKVGDTLVLQEFDPQTGKYSGRVCSFEITYINDWDNPCALSRVGLNYGYCVLSILRKGEVLVD